MNILSYSFNLERPVIMITLNNKESDYSVFLPYEELKEKLLEEFDDENEYVRTLIDILVAKGFIIVIRYEEQKYVHIKDFELCRRIVRLNIEDCEDSFYKDGIWAIHRIRIRNDTCVYYEDETRSKKLPSFARNILIEDWGCDKVSSVDLKIFNLLGCTIETSNTLIASYVQNAIFRKYNIDKKLRESDFAKSGYYMGSKKKLIGFLIEAMYMNITDNTVFLDLMCGSGVVSNALSLFGDVYASDAQRFCQLLAGIQGAGFSLERAKKVLSKIHINYMNNLLKLQNEFIDVYDKEVEIFHIDQSDNNIVYLYNKYIEYIQSSPNYSDTFPNEASVEEYIVRRRKDHSVFPYCLFTLYFSNIYFGFEQCMELDSIRYAIDKLEVEVYENDVENDIERRWALGCLEVAVSAVGSGYAGHFAQPLSITPKNIIRILNERQKSVWLEFSTIFLEWAKLSEGRGDNRLYPIRTISGPWKNALLQIKDKQLNELIVYLDAPYKRETYSRYYHVLETMALYDYPMSQNKGRIRSIEERAKTEFSTRNKDTIEKVLTEIIKNILEVGATCVWSYSNNATGSIINIVNCISEEFDCKINIYGIEHQYAKQGKKTNRKKGKTIPSFEYVVIFKRN